MDRLKPEKSKTMLAALFVLLALFATTSVGNVVGLTATSRLPHSAVLDADNRYHLAWDYDDQDIVFEVSVRTRGYIGLGFSPNGGMAGSDIVVGWVDDSTGVGHVSDRFAVSKSAPLVDEEQDYSLQRSEQNGTHTVLRFSRKLILCSDRDYDIKKETVRVIWAYSDSDPRPNGDIEYHSKRRGNKAMFLLNPQRTVPPLPANVITRDFLNPQVEIPTKDTTYFCQSFPVPKLDRKHHIVKVEPVIQPGHESEVHHILFYACYHDLTNTSSLNVGHECYHPNMPTDFWGCTSTILAWAVGGEDLYLPENVGLPIGYDGDANMFLMETHYDNPSGKAGLIDSSGFRVTMTPDLRKYDAGVIDAGQAVSPWQVIPPHFERFTTHGICFPECLSQAMEGQADGINVFGTMLHTHLLGSAMRVRHFREGIEQELIDEDSNYDFNYQNTRMLEKEVVIKPGDNLVVECDYKSTDLTEITFGGLSTRHEMCIGFLLYYPKIRLSHCMSSSTPQHLAAFAGVTINERTVITAPPEFVGPGKTLYNSLGTLVNWRDKSERERFQAWTSMPGIDGFLVECASGGYDYPIAENVRSYPKKLVELPPITCDGFRTKLSALLIVASIIASRCF